MLTLSVYLARSAATSADAVEMDPSFSMDEDADDVSNADADGGQPDARATDDRTTDVLNGKQTQIIETISEIGGDTCMLGYL